MNELVISLYGPLSELDSVDISLIVLYLGTERKKNKHPQIQGLAIY